MPAIVDLNARMSDRRRIRALAIETDLLLEHARVMQPLGLALYLAIVAQAAEQGQDSTMLPLSKIAGMVGVTINTTRLGLRKLETLGYIAISPIVTTDGRHVGNEYSALDAPQRHTSPLQNLPPPPDSAGGVQNLDPPPEFGGGVQNLEGGPKFGGGLQNLEGASKSQAQPEADADLHENTLVPLAVPITIGASEASPPTPPLYTPSNIYINSNKEQDALKDLDRYRVLSLSHASKTHETDSDTTPKASPSDVEAPPLFEAAPPLPTAKHPKKTPGEPPVDLDSDEMYIAETLQAAIVAVNPSAQCAPYKPTNGLQYWARKLRPLLRRYNVETVETVIRYVFTFDSFWRSKIAYINVFVSRFDTFYGDMQEKQRVGKLPADMLAVLKAQDTSARQRQTDAAPAPDADEGTYDPVLKVTWPGRVDLPIIYANNRWSIGNGARCPFFGATLINMLCDHQISYTEYARKVYQAYVAGKTAWPLEVDIEKFDLDPETFEQIAR